LSELQDEGLALVTQEYPASQEVQEVCPADEEYVPIAHFFSVGKFIEEQESPARHWV
jgi:hypothetical protein